MSRTSSPRHHDVDEQSLGNLIYTTSKKKIAEHGGLSFGDTQVGLIVSRPRMSSRVLKTPVLTSQVAPTILRALGLDPDGLKSVQTEQTPVLPGL